MLARELRCCERAGRAIAGLYQLIKAKFADDPDASAVLDAAEGAAEDSAEVRELADTLEKKAAADEVFGEQLRHTRSSSRPADDRRPARCTVATAHGDPGSRNSRPSSVRLLHARRLRRGG
ncbi:hypothetical protein B0293_04470 [Amycolatopsis azurea DSM 43854]|uniref:Uncharacterized protein n=1 Tax=Amycolatopsis azurea DSM 43854 TaxID=1238180 RepID=M2Q6T8_9PSEU|nr:hypothetical protein C791_0815 [Amycolatopsis azurea DSM 43854]OOC08337.1 hypothetical protein B0293_04470 [Amycolatopsis azurea DSM 43854]